MGLISTVMESTIGAWIKAQWATIHTTIMVTMIASAIGATAWATHRVDTLIAQGDENQLLKAKAKEISQLGSDKDAAEKQRDAKTLELDALKDSIHNDAAKHQHDDEVENAKPAYTSCKLPADGLQRLNQRIADSNKRRAATTERNDPVR